MCSAMVLYCLNSDGVSFGRGFSSAVGMELEDTAGGHCGVNSVDAIVVFDVMMDLFDGAERVEVELSMDRRGKPCAMVLSWRILDMRYSMLAMKVCRY